MLGKGWCTRLIARAKALEPDAILIVGDLFDGHKPHLEKLLPTLKQFQAPMGVWAVTGNHEYYNGLEQSVELMKDAGCKVLRDTSQQLAPGLILAGVDDLTARRQFGGADHAVERALESRPEGATILMSHSPWDVERAAACGVGLMLSGHTHNGQVWPFNYLVRSRYRHLRGVYNVSGMKLLVSCGAGTWGPRMRLWLPGEIHLITLRSPVS